MSLLSCLLCTSDRSVATIKKEETKNVINPSEEIRTIAITPNVYRYNVDPNFCEVDGISLLFSPRAKQKSSVTQRAALAYTPTHLSVRSIASNSLFPTISINELKYYIQGFIDFDNALAIARDPLATNKEVGRLLAIVDKAQLTPIVVKNHLAKPPEDWSSYSDRPNTFNKLFTVSMYLIGLGLKNLNWKGKELLAFCQSFRRFIEETRNDLNANEFGFTKSRPISQPLTKCYATSISHSRFYKYCLPSVFNIKLQDSYQLISQYEDNVQTNPSSYRPRAIYNESLFSVVGLACFVVVGVIEGKKIPLTEVAITPRNHFSMLKEDNTPAPKNIKACRWIHPNRKYHHIVMPHIHDMIDQAMKGNLSLIPHIHWWYIHLAPILRGPGGTIEMLIKSICQSHGVELPEWKIGIAPSIEVLLEPNEAVFCQNYHRLFEKENVFTPYDERTKQSSTLPSSQRDVKSTYDDSLIETLI
ncbi:MAG: hypothetical protein HAW66_09920 [Shewanella sp.]|nr:hypothetical protein [Shewanella sp.]